MLFVFCSVSNVVNLALLSSPSVFGNCTTQLFVLNDVTALEKFQGQSVNIVVVYNSYPSVYRNIYLNGVFFKSVTMDYTQFANLDTAYLGRSRTQGSGLGLSATFQEYRIYFGEITYSEAHSIFLVGIDQSHITLSSESTQTNMSLTFYSTSQVELDVQFYGGSPGPIPSNLPNVSTSFLYKMFGSETSFQLNPVDPQCAFRPTFSLDPHTSSTNPVSVPAMNYTITLLPNSLPAPQFSDTSCPSAITPCFCGVSESPFQYMSNANLLNQSFVVIDVNTTVSVFEYVYRTGLCYEVIGSEQFSLTEGEANNEKDSCFPENVFYMDMASSVSNINSPKNKQVQMNLFERYPEGTKWFTVTGPNQYVAKEWTKEPLVNWFIENSQLEILDQISGGNSLVPYDYDTTLQKSCQQCHTAVPVGYSYTLIASSVFPSFPFDLQFQIYAARSGPDGTFTVDNTWYIPVLGLDSNAVSSFYPVSSDPTLIFLVLRDPPGDVFHVVFFL